MGWSQRVSLRSARVCDLAGVGVAGREQERWSKLKGAAECHVTRPAGGSVSCALTLHLTTPHIPLSAWLLHLLPSSSSHVYPIPSSRQTVFELARPFRRNLTPLSSGRATIAAAVTCHHAVPLPSPDQPHSDAALPRGAARINSDLSSCPHIPLI